MYTILAGCPVSTVFGEVKRVRQPRIPAVGLVAEPSGVETDGRRGAPVRLCKSRSREKTIDSWTVGDDYTAHLSFRTVRNSIFRRAS